MSFVDVIVRSHVVVLSENVIVAVGPATADPAQTTSNASTATVAAMILRMFVLLLPPLCPLESEIAATGFGRCPTIFDHPGRKDKASAAGQNYADE
jgi:hypothetical protein